MVFRARVQFHITGQLGRIQNNNDDGDGDDDEDDEDDDDDNDDHGDDNSDDNNKKTSQELEMQSYGDATSLIICHMTRHIITTYFFYVMFEHQAANGDLLPEYIQQGQWIVRN